MKVWWRSILHKLAEDDESPREGGTEPGEYGVVEPKGRRHFKKEEFVQQFHVTEKSNKTKIEKLWVLEQNLLALKKKKTKREKKIHLLNLTK